MGVNWSAGQLRWKSHMGTDGKVYSLAHVHPFTFDIHFGAYHGQPARSVRVNVGFSMHVFTCSVTDAGLKSELYSDDREVRAFSPERYLLSYRLRKIVSEIETRKCYFTEHLNYFTFDLEGQPPGYEYRVFFDVRRQSTNGVEMIVQSAYSVKRAELPHGRRHKNIRFHVIVSAALFGRRPKVPS